MALFLRTTLTCLITAVVGCVLILSPAGRALEEGFGLSWLFGLRGPVSAPADVLVVTIDESSAVQLDQPTKLREWDRSIHADLVQRLSDRGATAIVFDIFFDQPRADHGDIQFAREIGQSQNVILVQKVVRDQHGPLTIDRLINPAPELSGAALGLAPFPLPKIGNRYGHFWAFFSGVSDSATLPVVALQVHVIGLYGYDNFVALLKNAGYLGAGELPARISRWSHLQLLMESLRRTLGENPGIYANLREQFADSDHSKALLALAATYTGDDSYTLNFYGPPGSVPTVDYSDFWADSESQHRKGLLDLSNKTVFIGGVAQSANTQGDAFFTVISSDEGVDIGGVEVAATAFSNMLEQNTLRRTGKLMDLGVVLIFGVLIAAVARMFSGVRTALVVITGGAAYFALAYYLFAGYQIWTPIVTPIAVQMPLALSMAYLAQYLHARQDRDTYSRAIRHYVPERVAKQFDEGQEPGTQPEFLFAVCMCTDIEGFTTLAEKSNTDELAELARQYFRQLTECVKRHDGEILESRGDGMICAWPAPAEDKISSHRACLAARDILETVRRFNEQHERRQLPTRIGLHAGRIALGSVGGGGHLTFSVIGDAINTAARIQDLNKTSRTRLLASAEVVYNLDDWLCRRVCSFQPKGKEEVLSIYEVFGPGDEVPDEANELCRSFAMATDLFEQADWAEAEKAFAAILQSRPDDGPSQFYLQRCQQYLVSPPALGEQMMIRSGHHA